MGGLWGIFEKNVGQSDKKFRLGWEFRQCSGLTCRLEQTGHLFSDPGAFPLRVGGFEILAGMDPVHSQTVGVSFKGADGGFFLNNVPLRDRKFRFGWGFPGRSGLKMHLEAPGNLHWHPRALWDSLPRTSCEKFQIRALIGRSSPGMGDF